jgi:L-rhamnose-H+ transport protein
MIVALMLVLIAGGMNGSFAVPMKFVRGWRWEQTWLLWSFLAMSVLPLALAVITFPGLLSAYRMAGADALMLTAFCGMLWGAGTVLFGLGIDRLGLALSFGIVLGTSSASGVAIPLLLLHREQAFTHAGLRMLAGVGIILAGVAWSARGGQLREKTTNVQTNKGSFASGLVICLMSGLGSACMSLALNEAAPIAAAAHSLGASQSASVNAAWPILLGGGFIVNAVYCIFQLVRHRDDSHGQPTTVSNVVLVVGMAVLWSGSNFVFAAGARRIGPLGLIFGWPVYMAAIVLTANVWGLLSGEWRNAGRRAIAWAAAGCIFLITGIWEIASAGTG